MLTDKLKETIRNAHKAIGENLPNYMPRKQQNLLVAEIAKTLAGEYSKDRRIITIEAGTGTGKSLAYCLSTIPLALAKSKKVCISTATVALQEQLVNKDLPFLKKYAGLNFEFVLAKGRQRYVCRQKLTQAVSTDSPQVGFTFAEKPKANDIRTLNAMHKALLDGSWQGDIDSWQSTLPQHIWHQVQCDKHSCLKHLSEHSHCPFHKARETMEQANVLVVNHSLLLADLELGGGRILSTPEDTYYVIDEAHHLPKVTRDHSSANMTLKGAIDWLKKISETGDKMAKLIKSQKAISPALKLADDCQDLLIEIQKVLTFIENNSAVYFPASHEDEQSNFKKNDEQVYRFENGIIPKTLKNWSHDIKELSKKTLSSLNKLYNILIEAVKEGDTQMYLAEPLLGEAGFLIQRLENLEALWTMYAKTDREHGAPTARWLENLTANDKRKRQDYMLCASPIDVGFALEDMLWSQCAGAVLCSATLMALNSFDHFRYQAGLRKDDGSQYQHVNSPFDYQKNAELVVAKMNNEPSSPEFTDELIEKIPSLLAQSKEQCASLVLFSSYWQMEKVAKSLRDDHQLKILVQGEDSRQYIIDKHKENCDNNKSSIIFGTQSFSEGLDLPGNYLTNLIITKLPFSVPTSPVEQAQAEHVTAKGGNPFMTLSVPDTSKKLVQACGRLLRNEKDTGQIFLLDKRAVTKRYGKQLLDSLPPFKRIIE
ncbi:ATP-dependent DNA helicase DinG [Colwellia sp. RSH04]|uniref:ATP-dependent DNA helicase DinG n=1 Tax=Colwellia sp. RSH04 TaxID=2305464 RepID=UPI000E59132E|nr:ATP-dependent DNA helicase DinG [Colwellia sp. RSH04]RHW77037.1 ATP-dependent DNA helicase DinG [Colwellia sp. RSH04]